MFSSHQDEDLWILIAKVVSGNASEEEQVQLSSLCRQYPEIHQVTLELQAFWNGASLTSTVDSYNAWLANLGRVQDESVRFLRTSREARGMRQLVPGRMVRAETGDDGRLIERRRGVKAARARPRRARPTNRHGGS